MSFLDIMRMLVSLYIVGGEPELRFTVNGDAYSIRLNDKSCLFRKLKDKDSEVTYSDFVDLFHNAVIDGICLSDCWNRAERITIDGCAVSDYEVLLNEYKSTPACREQIDRRKKEYLYCKQHDITEFFPDVVRLIREDLLFGFSVLGIPEAEIRIVLYDYNKFDMEGICAVSDPGINCFLYNLDYKLIDNDENRTDLSFVTWGVLRMWFRGKAIGKYRKNKVLLPNVTEEDITEWQKYEWWYSSFTKEERARVTASRKYTQTDVYAFSLMLTKRQYPNYEENNVAKADFIQDRLRYLSEIYK